MKYHYLSPEEINNLKLNLMNRQKRSYSHCSSRNRNQGQISTSRSFSNLYKQNRHSEICPLFEDNIRQTLIHNYKWKNIDRHFSFRLIRIGHRNILIKQGCAKKILVKGKRYIFSFQRNKNISIYNGYIKRRFIGIIKKKKTDKVIILNSATIKISRVQECEIDGFFGLENSKFSDIQNKSLISLYNNTNDSYINNVEYVCIEVKLSKRSITSLISQIERDRIVLENYIGYTNILYVGFIGGIKKENIDFDNINIPKNINLIVFEIHNCCWDGNNLTYYINWEAISELSKLKCKISVMENYIKKLLKRK